MYNINELFELLGISEYDNKLADEYWMTNAKQIVLDKRFSDMMQRLENWSFGISDPDVSTKPNPYNLSFDSIHAFMLSASYLSTRLMSLFLEQSDDAEYTYEVENDDEIISIDMKFVTAEQAMFNISLRGLDVPGNVITVTRSEKIHGKNEPFKIECQFKQFPLINYVRVVDDDSMNEIIYIQDLFNIE